jgi:S-adenosyl-L-methionine hydrolase (adenosine-forming)
VLRVDHFGNAVTNLTVQDVPAFAGGNGGFVIRTGNAVVSKVVPTFAQGAAGEAIGVIGSSGYLEITVNKANAARSLGIARGAEVTVELS